MKKLVFLNIPIILLIIIGTKDGNAVCRIKNQDNPDIKIDDFCRASDFFFSTLSENFGKNDGENLYRLMRIIVDNSKKVEDFYRLQVNNKKFKSLNNSIEPVYDKYFPKHIYIYNDDNGSRGITEKTILNKECDTIVISIPKMECPIIRNSYLEGAFKYSFSQQLSSLSIDSPIFFEIRNFLDGTGLYSSLDFSINMVNKYTPEELQKMCENITNRVLITLVFWEYLSDCANYDLNTREFFYESSVK